MDFVAHSVVRWHLSIGRSLLFPIFGSNSKSINLQKRQLFAFISTTHSQNTVESNENPMDFDSSQSHKSRHHNFPINQHFLWHSPLFLCSILKLLEHSIQTHHTSTWTWTSSHSPFASFFERVKWIVLLDTRRHQTHPIYSESNVDWTANTNDT